jgi:hypothetical protein
MRHPRDQLRDRLLDAPDEVAPHNLPPRFGEARVAVAHVLARLESEGIPAETLVMVMMAEALPRMVHQNGPEWAAAMMTRLAQSLAPDASPRGTRQ